MQSKQIGHASKANRQDASRCPWPLIRGKSGSARICIECIHSIRPPAWRESAGSGSSKPRGRPHMKHLRASVSGTNQHHISPTAGWNGYTARNVRPARPVHTIEPSPPSFPSLPWSRRRSSGPSVPTSRSCAPFSAMAWRQSHAAFRISAMNRTIRGRARAKRKHARLACLSSHTQWKDVCIRTAGAGDECVEFCSVLLRLHVVRRSQGVLWWWWWCGEPSSPIVCLHSCEWQ